MPDRIDELRVSLVGVRLHPHLVRSTLPARPSWAALAAPSVYVAAAAQARTRDQGVELPWPDDGDTRDDAQHFWFRYLGATGAPGSAGDAALWSNLVPLRTRTDATVVDASGAGGVGTVRSEAFHYAHATAVVLTFAVVGALTPADAAEAAFDARVGARFTLTAGGRARSHLTLDTVMATLLAQCALGRRGAGARAPGPPLDTFSIATVIRGNGAAGTPVPPGKTVHRALDTLATWKPTYRAGVPGDLDVYGHHPSHAPLGHLLFVAPRGRAVWYPDLFTSTARTRKAGCLHRNLTLLTMQTQALLGVVWLEARSDHASALRSMLLQRAVGILGRVYGPGPAMPPISDMYQSWSARRQIDDSGVSDLVDTYRRAFDMPPLARTPAPAPAQP